MKKVLLIVLSFSLLLGLGQTALAKIRLKLGCVSPPSHPQAISLMSYADYVNKQTNGEITIDVFPMGQLGGERSMAEQVQSGTLDMADITTAVMSNFVPQVALYDLPFLWPSRGVAYSVLSDSQFFRIFADTLPPKGFMMIGYGENEMRDLTNTKRIVRKPADVKGLKIRVMEAPIFLDTWTTLGASPVPMPFPEIYSALQQGVIDAQENPLMTSVLMKFTEVSTYATITNYSLTSTIKIVNIDVWNRFTPEQQQILLQGAQLAMKENRERSIDMISDIVGKLEAEGKVTITRLTKAERDEFAKAVQPLYAEYEKKTGKIPNKKEYGRYAGMSYLQMIREKIKQYE